MISFLGRYRCAQNGTRLFSLVKITGVVGNSRIYTVRNPRHRKTLSSRFFIKPKLEIIYDPQDKTVEHISEVEDHRWGIVHENESRITTPEGFPILLSPIFYPKRRFINVIVKNNGRGLAENCQVNVRLLDKTDGCQWLSSEEKSLVWDDGSPIRTIGAKGNKTMFHLAFSQQRLARYQVDYISSLYCGIAKKRVKYDL